MTSKTCAGGSSAKSAATGPRTRMMRRRKSNEDVPFFANRIFSSQKPINKNSGTKFKEENKNLYLPPGRIVRDCPFSFVFAPTLNFTLGSCESKKYNRPWEANKPNGFCFKHICPIIGCSQAGQAKLLHMLAPSAT